MSNIIKREYNDNGKLIYHENSNGKQIYYII
jgi:hypothetical protein